MVNNLSNPGAKKALNSFITKSIAFTLADANFWKVQNNIPSHSTPNKTAMIMKFTLKFTSIATAAGLACLLSAGNLHAGNTWDGGGGNGSWSDLANWDSNSTPVSPTLLTFGGTSQLASNNDLFAAATTFNGITFASGAGAFTLSGNSITLGGGVTNSSSNTQTISLNLATGGTARTFTATTNNIDLTGIISGSGGVTAAGAGIVTLSNASNSFSGVARANTGGTLSFSSAANLGTATYTVQGNFQYTGSGAANLTATTNFAGGAFDVTQAAATITLSGGYGASGGNSSFTKTGAGTLDISEGANAASQILSVVVNQGALRFSDAAVSNVGPSSVTVNSGATLRLAGASSQLSSTGTLTLNSGGTLDLQATQVVGTLSGAGLITSTTSGTKFIRPSAASGTATFSGVIENGSGGGITQLQKNGASTLILSNTNTYTGTTQVNAGTLLINGSLAAGAVSVANTATLGGTGIIGGATTMSAGSKLSAGDSSASLLSFTNNLTLSAAANDSQAFVFTLGTVSDRVAVGGTLTIGSGLIDFADFSFTAGSGFGGGTYTLFDNTVLSGTLAAINLTGDIGGFSSTLALSGNDIVLNVVPEPSTFAMFLGGFGILLVLQRARRRRSDV